LGVRTQIKEGAVNMSKLLNEQANTVTREMVCDTGTSWLLDYDLQAYESSDGTVLYGAKITKRSQNGAVAEQAETFALTENRNKAIAIQYYLASGLVPPCVLLEMVDEWFSNEVWNENEDDYSSPPMLPIWHTYHKGA